MSPTTPKTIKITYDLKIPSGSGTGDAGDRPTSRTFQYEVSTIPTQDQNQEKKTLEVTDVKAYCTSLRTALERARNEVGDELTRWRDVVGKAELSKEPRQGRGVEGEEGEEEEGEEEEEEEV